MMTMAFVKEQHVTETTIAVPLTIIYDNIIFSNIALLRPFVLEVVKIIAIASFIQFDDHYVIGTPNAFVDLLKKVWLQRRNIQWKLALLAIHQSVVFIILYQSMPHGDDNCVSWNLFCASKLPNHAADYRMMSNREKHYHGPLLAVFLCNGGKCIFLRINVSSFNFKRWKWMRNDDILVIVLLFSRNVGWHFGRNEFNWRETANSNHTWGRRRKPIYAIIDDAKAIHDGRWQKKCRLQTSVYRKPTHTDKYLHVLSISISSRIYNNKVRWSEGVVKSWWDSDELHSWWRRTLRKRWNTIWSTHLWSSMDTRWTAPRRRRS